MDFLSKFGKNIKILRTNAGLSQEEFAYRIGLHRTSITRIERGKHFIDWQTLEKIAEVLNVEYSVLFDFENEKLKTQKQKIIGKITEHLNHLDENTLKAILAGFNTAFKKNK